MTGRLEQRDDSRGRGRSPVGATGRDRRASLGIIALATLSALFFAGALAYALGGGLLFGREDDAAKRAPRALPREWANIRPLEPLGPESGGSATQRRGRGASPSPDSAGAAGGPGLGGSSASQSPSLATASPASAAVPASASPGLARPLVARLPRLDRLPVLRTRLPELRDLPRLPGGGGVTVPDLDPLPGGVEIPPIVVDPLPDGVVIPPIVVDPLPGGVQTPPIVVDPLPGGGQGPSPPDPLPGGVELPAEWPFLPEAPTSGGAVLSVRSEAGAPSGAVDAPAESRDDPERLALAAAARRSPSPYTAADGDEEADGARAASGRRPAERRSGAQEEQTGRGEEAGTAGDGGSDRSEARPPRPRAERRSRPELNADRKETSSDARSRGDALGPCSSALDASDERDEAGEPARGPDFALEPLCPDETPFDRADSTSKRSVDRRASRASDGRGPDGGQGETADE
jgi:hypothetical protein